MRVRVNALNIRATVEAFNIRVRVRVNVRSIRVRFRLNVMANSSYDTLIIKF